MELRAPGAPPIDPLVALAPRVAARAFELLPALIAISSPFGDRDGAERAVELVARALRQAVAQRLPSSSPGIADDLLLTLSGEGKGRLLLLGHLDTVIGHDDHQPVTVDGDRVNGSGTIDMKGGDVLAIAIMDELARDPSLFAQIDLLLVCDEEWRTRDMHHAERFAGYDGCLCFEGGERDGADNEVVIVQRKAATTLRVVATGRASHAGAAPDEGRNALLGLAQVAQQLAALHDPHGSARRSVVPTVLRSGDALNVLPGDGELMVDARADDEAALREVASAVPAELDGVTFDTTFERLWPAMDSRAAAAPVIRQAELLLGRTIRAGSRGGASDASHLARAVPCTIDGLGPLGGGSHAPSEHLLASSLLPRAEVALALTSALLRLGGSPQ